MYAELKRILIGKPFPTRDDIHQRLDNVRALAIFASDPISSNAYATEAIMSILLLLGTAALRWTMPLAIGVATLVLIVVNSYVQTIRHYPDGGGAYTVTKDNFGTLPSLFAAAALLIDYVLTVSVSVSAGMRALTSAFPALEPGIVFMAVGAIVILTWVNLRGVRESGTIFALPTYAFIVGVLLVLGIGIWRTATGTLTVPPPDPAANAPITASSAVLIWFVVRAFAAGCTALTGIEAISNGVQAFKKPEADNAIRTMVAMGAIAMSLFVGISYLSTHLHLIPNERETILSQLTRAITGSGVLYYWVQASTMMILVLAANTGYQDFPRLSSYLARDGFMPRWMQNRGDRLVYNAGIMMLAALASVIVLVFRADELAMLPLYALGVMLSFTLSQSSMVRLMGRIAHLKPGESLKTKVTTVHYEAGTVWKRAMNGVGAVATGTVLVALTITKFLEGAWVVVVAIPLLVLLFRSVKKHYMGVAAALRTSDFEVKEIRHISDICIVPIGDVHRGTLIGLHYAKRFAKQVRAVAIATDPQQKERFMRRWERFSSVTDGVELEMIEYDYRDILTPLVAYIEQIKDGEHPDEDLIVVIPEFVSHSLFGEWLHNRTAQLLQNRLRAHEGIVLIDVPYHLDA
jgi:amino acid transporter